jgi:hypothetical protein
MPDQGRRTSAHAARRLDSARLAGAWVNTEDPPRVVARVVIEPRPDTLAIWASEADDRTDEGLGWTDAESLYAASASDHDAIAFSAAFCEGPTPVAFHANVSKGLLIVSSFRPCPGADHSNARFAREFFRRDSSGLPRPPRLPGKQPAAQVVSPPSPFSTFVGHWRNTASPGSSIDSVSFAASDFGLKMEAVGSDWTGPRDWGTADVEVYVEVGAVSDPAKIKVFYDLGSMGVLLHGWVKQGVLVLALFRRFKDGGGRSDYFDREFFYRTD